MNRRNFSALALLAMATLMTAAVASAQDRARADIPFAFRAGNKPLPAGTYEVNIGRLDSRTIVVQNSETGDASAILVQSLDEPRRDTTDATLVFHKCGSLYFLSQVRMPDLTRNLPMTKLEREVTREQAESAANDAGPRLVYIAARLP